MSKINCWEFKKCERYPGGKNEKELGTCPVTTDDRLDTIHGGLNAGRACWIIAGSMCGGKIQGSFAKKFQSCKSCEFYGMVKKEEFPKFELSATLLKRLS